MPPRVGKEPIAADRGAVQSTISLKDEKYGRRNASRIKQLGPDQDLRSRKQRLSESIFSIYFTDSKKYSLSPFNIPEIES